MAPLTATYRIPKLSVFSGTLAPIQISSGYAYHSISKPQRGPDDAPQIAFYFIFTFIVRLFFSAYAAIRL